MRIRYVLLLEAGAFIGSAKTNSVVTDSTPSTATLADPLTSGNDDVPVLRFLRTTASADEDDQDGEQNAEVHKDDEERISFNFLSDFLKETPNTKAYTSKLTTLRMGMNDKTSMEYKFRKSGLMKAKDKLLEHPNFNGWFTAMKDLHPENFNEEAVSMLLRYYSDDQLYKALDAATKVESTKDDAKGLQNALIKSWLDKNRSPLDVFKKMEQGRELDDILTSQILPVWNRYVDDYNTANPGHEKTAIKVLLDSYDEKDVFKMLQAAKEVDGTGVEVVETRELAKNFQKELTEYWLNEKKYSPLDVFKVMEHDRKLNFFIRFENKEMSPPELEDILTRWRKNLPVWTKYVDDFNGKYSGHMTNAIDVLQAHYDDSTVYMILQSAKMSPSTEKLATIWKKQQIQNWLDAKTSPLDVFKVLEHGRELEDILTCWRKNLPVWTKYVDDFNGKYSGHMTNAIDVLQAHYDDSTVYMILQSAKMSPGTEKLATIWKKQQIQNWLDEKTSPLIVFRAVERGRKLEDVLTSSNLPVWTKYLDDFNAKEQDDQVPPLKEIDVLLTYYDEKAVFKMLEAAKKEGEKIRDRAAEWQEQQMKYFVEEKYSPKRVFGVLGIDFKQVSPKDPNLPFWLRHVISLHKINKLGSSILRSSLGEESDAELSKLLIAAKQDSNKEVQKMAAELQVILVAYWRADKVPVDKVHKWLKVGGKPHDAPERLMWKEYQEFIRKKSKGESDKPPEESA